MKPMLTKSTQLSQSVRGRAANSRDPIQPSATQVVDPTQQAEGEASQWTNEPVDERSSTLLVHTLRPFNAEPPNQALQQMITPKGQHYRRQHTPVPMVDETQYSFSVAMEGEGCSPVPFTMSELKEHEEHEVVVTLMCTGNRRSEFNTDQEGETMGLPWKNGSISTASWSGAKMADVLRSAVGDLGSLSAQGFRFVTFWGIEDYHVSIPLSKGIAEDGDVLLAWGMNGEVLPRDHGFPLRVVVPGYVGARSVKWLDRIVISKHEAEGMHQRGIAYKQLAPNQKSLAGVTREHIESLPPIDRVPITSAITHPEPGCVVYRGDQVVVTGYAYSGTGCAVIRVDVSVDGGATWTQAELLRASETQRVRSGRAWAWVQWKCTFTVPLDSGVPTLSIVCKGIDDQYNQQPHDPAPIWNLRGILNTSWGRIDANVMDRSRL